ncbi:MAG TPA: hypothetical protein VGO45_00860 [Bacteroidia bacterium]|nr:hypothetical protein [Bacteroidia bacterium]
MSLTNNIFSQRGKNRDDKQKSNPTSIINNPKFISEWKKDSLSCMGLRYTYAKYLDSESSSLKGSALAGIESVFGKPNRISSDEPSKTITYIYYLKGFCNPREPENEFHFFIAFKKNKVIAAGIPIP